MTKFKHVFLDLEGTVITIIDDPCLGNIDLVKNWLEDEETLAVGIFSFAIDNKKERDEFMRGWICRTLEHSLNVTIGKVVTTEDALAAARQRNRVQFEGLWEFKQLWGKERGFIDYVRQNFTNAEVVLLDDMVEDMVVEFPSKNLTIRLVNVDNLKVSNK